MSAVWKPINLFQELASRSETAESILPYPLQFCYTRDALQGVISRLQHDIVWLIFWEVELGSFDLRERSFYDLPHDISDGLGTVKSTVEIPAAEIQLGGNCIEFFVVQRVLCCLYRICDCPMRSC